VAKNWFKDRGLSPSSYKDYQNREIVPAWKLAALNMRNQHINPDRMSLLNRIRLLETSLFIDDSDNDVWLSNLFVFNELFIQNKNKNKNKNKLINIVGIYDIHYSEFEKYLASSSDVDSKLFEAAQWFFSQAAYTYVMQGKLKLANNILLKHYLDAYQLSQVQPKILSNNQVVFQELLKSYLNNKQYTIAEDLIIKTHMIAPLQEDWLTPVEWYYSQRISPMWKNKNWTEIINYWKKINSHNIPIAEMEMFIKNISAAYQNKSLSFERKGNWRAAAEVLLQCTENIPLAIDCTKKLDKLNSRHNLF
jgi:tetratricopeptide (TPR) repeat protein